MLTDFCSRLRLALNSSDCVGFEIALTTPKCTGKRKLLARKYM